MTTNPGGGGSGRRGRMTWRGADHRTRIQIVVFLIVLTAVGIYAIVSNALSATGRGSGLLGAVALFLAICSIVQLSRAPAGSTSPTGAGGAPTNRNKSAGHFRTSVIVFTLLLAINIVTAFFTHNIFATVVIGLILVGGLTMVTLSRR